MADDPKLDRLIRSFPSIYKAASNPTLNAVLQGISTSDDNIVLQTQNAKDQLFVRTATGTNLDNLANSLGVSRPLTLGLSDEQFQELIPNLSLKAKQIRKAFYDTAEVFWGAYFVFANVQTGNTAPFNIVTGDTLVVKINQNAPQTIKVLSGDIQTQGAATSQELVNILSRIRGATPSIVDDILNNTSYVNLAIDTPGPVGILNIQGGSMLAANKLNVEAGVYKLTEQAQRFAVYNLKPNQLTIEIPAVVPALEQTLLGSHHFHADATIEAPQPPDEGIWQGSFLYDPRGTQQSFTITGQAATTLEPLNKGDVYVKVTVNSTAGFVAQSGYLVFGYGTATQEEPVRFRGIPNSNTVLLDPSYVFKNNQPSGTVINVLSSLTPFVPSTDGSDLAVYLTSPAEARAEVETILASLAAAGIIITFVVLAPTYTYLITNPYLEE